MYVFIFSSYNLIFFKGLNVGFQPEMFLIGLEYIYFNFVRITVVTTYMYINVCYLHYFHVLDCISQGNILAIQNFPSVLGQTVSLGIILSIQNFPSVLVQTYSLGSILLVSIYNFTCVLEQTVTVWATYYLFRTLTCVLEQTVTVWATYYLFRTFLVYQNRLLQFGQHTIYLELYLCIRID